MKNTIIIAPIAALGLLAFQSAAAQVLSEAGDAPRGASLAPVCTGCHGQHGEGVPGSGAPRLAGQPAGYLAKQLRDFAAGTRESAIMAPFAKIQTEQAILDLSAYFSAEKAPATKTATSGPPKVDLAKGGMLANIGDSKLGVQACGNCHGPGGRGVPPDLPYLAGQSGEYISAQLKAWHEGKRHNDDGQQMATVAGNLAAADMAAVAEYFAREHPPNEW
ncbi:MAG TPA: c-type cytochrome [Rhodanobacteraceae bacterium]|jgi:cytochrome c553|nr:c-type cytochrome [Rhodanobacteraceae bacterium]